jgi:hypothetical protein
MKFTSLVRELESAGALTQSKVSSLLLLVLIIFYVNFFF